MKQDTIGGLAKAAGVGVETVRYYQRLGLLAEPPRLYGEARRYDETHLQRLQFIRSAQAAGFTLTEIAALLELDAADDRPRARDMARMRIAALDEKIAELTKARNALQKLAKDCASGGAGPCPIIAAFDHGEPV